MKNQFVILFSLSSAFYFAQTKIEYKNIDVGFGGFSVKLKNSGAENESGGLTFNLSNTISIDKNLISLDFLTGGGVGDGLVGVGGDYKFYRFNLLYGRSFKLLDWLVIEPNAGIGYYHQNSELYFTDEQIKNSVVNFPLKVALTTGASKRVGVGINAGYDINKLNNTFSGNIFLRVNIVKD